MASIFGHALLGLSFTKAVLPKSTTKTLSLAAFCTFIPDADVIAFSFGIPYDHMLGHRGFSHSILFAVMLALLLKWLFYRKVAWNTRQGILLISIFFLCTLSHSLLDALTNGGLGVAWFAPFYPERYFFPWRPIQVSPIGASNFFSAWGLRVIKSELLWIGVPSLIVLFAGALRNKNRFRSTKASKI